MNEETKMLLELLMEQKKKEQEKQAAAALKGRKKENPPKADRAQELMEQLLQEENPQQEAENSGEHDEEILKVLLDIKEELHRIGEILKPDKKGVPAYQKYALSLDEAAQYFHIGTRVLREIMIQDTDAEYWMWKGNARLIKREKFAEYLDKIQKI